MDQKISLADKLQEMEHSNLQLASETETIGEKYPQLTTSRNYSIMSRQMHVVDYIVLRYSRNFVRWTQGTFLFSVALNFGLNLLPQRWPTKIAKATYQKGCNTSADVAFFKLAVVAFALIIGAKTFFQTTC